MISVDSFVFFSLLVIGALTLLIAYTFKLFFRIKVIEFSIIASFFLFSAIFYTFVLLAYSYDLLIYYQLERFFLISSYWFLLILISKIGNSGWVYKFFIWILFLYSLILLGLVALWDKGVQPERGNFFGTTIDSVENVPYHPQGASVSFDNFDFIYGTSFPLLNTIYMLMVTALLLYTFSTVDLQLKTKRIKNARQLWLVSLTLHLGWIILALPWIDLAREFQIINFVSSTLIIIIILFYPEGLILSKSQIMATYHLYDRSNDFESFRNTSSNISNYAVENILDYLNSIPEDIVQISKEQRKC